MINIILIAAIIIAIIIIICLFAWYRIVKPSEAHLVVTRNKKMIVSSDDKIATDGKKTYFSIPSGIPFIGRQVRVMDLTIKEAVVEQESYEKNQARFKVKSSTKYRISKVGIAAETFDNDVELRKQLEEVIVSSTNAVASQYDVTEMRSKKSEMSDAIRKEMQDDLEQWGLSLISFQLIDFRDTDKSSIISDISMRREVEIESRTREENAEKKKNARIKEADAEELAKTREIAKDMVIAEREQNKAQKIAEQEKLAEEKRLEVVRVVEIKRAEIDKDKAIVLANQRKDTEIINKETKQLEGEGDRLKAEEMAKGEAAPIREKGIAEAEAKEKLQAALNKFTPEAIIALTAELVVEKDKVVGVETAKALTAADVKVFAGGDGAAKDGFDLGKMISAMSTSDRGTANAALNKIARENDLGFVGLKVLADKEAVSNPKKKVTSTKKSNKNDGSI
ncbi:hypothetical protein LCGC14_0442250 [marine sediment metagenome]|uniref:Band 7 domain-containing protein n=1 Tax=marine sediment metagenome TaxID=412755 RepID=A0A0F9SK42_9ZZZZ